MENIITNEAEEFIKTLFAKEIRESLTYHDIIHTEYVASQAEQIGKNSGLSNVEVNIVKVAAWFHDSGFVIHSKNHEDESQKIARKFLSGKGVSEDHIEKTIRCIQATTMPQNPGDDILAKVVCDADMAYLSEDFYIKRSNLLRKEWNNESETKLSKKAYYTETIELFKTHAYHTAYGDKTFSPGKEVNFQLLLSLLNKEPKKSKSISASLYSENKQLIEKAVKKKLPGRGVESMFRLTARNQINLSSIADNKANILISINTIVLTVLLSVGVGKISDYPIITFPAIVFSLTCLVTIIFAILSTRPKISSGKFSKEDIDNRKINLLFFGNFYNMKLEDYEWAVKEMMNDQNYLYSSMIRDQYSLGRVVGQKYKLLRTAYTVFMIGLVLSFLLYALLILFIPG